MDSIQALTNLKAALKAEILAELRAELKAEILAELKADRDAMEPKAVKAKPKKLSATFNAGEYDILEADEEAMALFKKWYKNEGDLYRHPKHAFNSLCKNEEYIMLRRSSDGSEYITTACGDEIIFLPPHEGKAKAEAKNFYSQDFEKLMKDKECAAVFMGWYKSTSCYRHPRHAFNALCKQDTMGITFRPSARIDGSRFVYMVSGNTYWAKASI